MPVLITRSIIGLLQGLVLAQLISAYENRSIDMALWIPVFMVMEFVPTLIIQSLGTLRKKTLLYWTVCATFILALVAYYAVWRQPDQSQMPWDYLALFLPTVISVFIAHALVLSGDIDHRFKALYPTYFNISWKLGIQLVFTLVFTAVFWFLLWLGAVLFILIDLNFFKDLVTNHWFATPATTVATAIALHLTDVKVSLIEGIRTVFLLLMSRLLPIIAFIIGLFLICLLYTGPAPLWKTGHASWLLLITSALLIMLINTAYQDGINSLPLLQRSSIKLACILLIPVVTLAIYALSLRVLQYGWAVERIYAAVGMLILLAYAIGYFIAAINRQHPLKLIETTNFAVSCLILLAWLALYLPLADPARLMVNSQIARLQSGHIAPEQFDFKALRIKGERFGKEALQTLQHSWRGSKKEYVSEQASIALALKPGDVPTLTSDATTRKQMIIVHPNTATLPDSFLQQQWDGMDGAIKIPACLNTKSTSCQAWIIVNPDKSTMVLILDTSGFIGFTQNGSGKWTAIGTWKIPNGCLRQRYDAQEGKFALVPPLSHLPDIEILGWRSHFEANENLTNCE